MVHNGFCNDETNNLNCNYDGGDCCGYNINSEHCTECNCFHQETCLVGMTGESEIGEYAFLQPIRICLLATSN